MFTLGYLKIDEEDEGKMYAADYLYNLLWMPGWRGQEHAQLQSAFRGFLDKLEIARNAKDYATQAYYCKDLLEKALGDPSPEPSEKEQQIAQGLKTLLEMVKDSQANNPEKLQSAHAFFSQFYLGQYNMNMQNKISEDLGKWKHRPTYKVEFEQYQLKQTNQISNTFEGLKKVVTDIGNGFNKSAFKQALSTEEKEGLNYIQKQMNDFLDKTKVPETVEKLKALPQVVREYGREIEDFTRSYQKKYKQAFDPGQSALTKLVNWVKDIFKKKLPNPMFEQAMNKTMDKIREGLVKVNKEIKQFKSIKKPERKGPKPE